MAQSAAHAAPVEDMSMSSQQVSTAPVARAIVIRLVVGLAATLLVLALLIGPANVGALVHLGQGSQLHAPRWDLLANSSLAIKIHLSTVLAAVILATIQMVGPKGRIPHRVLGWILSALLVFTAIAALFIRPPGAGLINPFQVFSAWTLIAVPIGVVMARRHNVRRHASMMAGLYFGGLIIAGALTFLPGRLMWRVFLG
jgi:uncharacterized membrane protein